MNRILNIKLICKIASIGFLLTNQAAAEDSRLTAVSLTKNSVTESEQKQLIKLTPEYQAKKLNELGVDLVLKSQTDEGIEAFEKGVELDPQNSTLRYNLAGVYLSKGDTTSALKHALKSVELKPDDLSFLHRLGEVYFAEKKFGEAEKLFEKIADLNPEFNEVMFHLGTVYAMQQKWPEAENALRRAKEIYPRHSSIETNLANVLIMTHKFSEAASILEKVNQEQPSAEVSLALGIANEADGNNEKAVLAYESAKTLGSKDDQLDSRITAVKKKLADLK